MPVFITKGMTIAGFVMKAIHDGKLYEGKGKEAGLKVVEDVKKEFPKSKFSLSHYYWYISRYSRQVSQKLGTDHLYVVDGSTNWTTSGESGENNTLVIRRNAALAGWYETQLDAIYAYMVAHRGAPPVALSTMGE